MTLLTNQTSRIYPKDEIYSYKVIVIKKETIKENDGIYTYDAYKFNSLNEYNNWKVQELNKDIEQKDKEIDELKNKINELQVEPPLVQRTNDNAKNIENLNEIADDLDMVIDSLITDILPNLKNN